MDTTRTTALSMQKGVKGAKMWKCGPLEFQRVEFHYGRCWGIGLWLGRFGFTASFNIHE